METAGLYIGCNNEVKGGYYRAALCRQDKDGTFTDRMDDHVYGCTLVEVLRAAVAKHPVPMQIVTTEPVNREGSEDFRIFSYHRYEPLSPLNVELARARLQKYQTVKRKPNKSERALVNA